MIYAIRHGERADFAGPPSEYWQNPIDPPITKNGLIQASITGQALLKTFEKQKVHQVYIYSSPFLRCLMTAYAIKDQIQKSHPVSKIRVTNGLFQDLNCFQPSDKPFSSLEVFKSERSEMMKNLEAELVEEDFKDKFGRPQFGKSGFEDENSERFQKAYKAIIEFHLGQIKEELLEAKRLGIVCVTHFTGIQMFNRLLKKESEDDLKSKYMSHKFCCISEGRVRLKEFPQNYEVVKVRMSDASHLSTQQ